MIPLPSQQTPLTLDGSFLSIAWRNVLEDVRRRLGGSQDITLRATSNTEVTVSYKGSDGVVRSGTITLS